MRKKDLLICPRAMAAPSSSHSISLVLFLISLPALLAQACLVEDNCMKYSLDDPASGLYTPTTPDVCQQCLYADARTVNATTQKDFASILLDCSIAAATAAADVADGQAPMCSKPFADASSHLTKALANVQGDNFGNARFELSYCFDSCSACGQILGGAGAVPKNVADALNKLRDSCGASGDVIARVK